MRTMRDLKWVLVLCAAACWPGVLAAQEPAPAPAPAPAEQAWAALPLLPQETLFAVSFRDLAQARVKLEETALWKIGSDENVLKAFKLPLLQVRAGLGMAAQQMGFTVKDLLETLQGEVTIGFLGYLPQRGEDGKPIPDVIVAVQPRGQMQKWMTYWNGLIDKLNTATQGTLAMGESNFDGVSITTISHPQAPFEIYYGVSEGTFMFSLRSNRLENLLAAKRISKAAGPPPEADQVKTLSQLPAFQRVQAKTGNASDALVYVNLEELRKIPDFNMDPANAEQAAQQKLAGVAAMKALAWSLRLEGPGMREVLYLDAPKAERTGLLTLLSGAALPAETLLNAPKQTLAAFAIQASPVDLLDRLIEVGGIVDPAARETANARLAELNQKLGIDVRQDLLGALSGQALLTLSAPAKNPKLTVGIPSPVLSLGVLDKAKAVAVLEALKKAGVAEMDYIDAPHFGTTITVARRKIVQGDAAGQICWAVKDDRVLVSLYPLALKDELDRLGDAVPQGTLADDAAFRAARERMEASQQALLYIDSAAIATAAYEILVPVGQIQSRRTPQVDLLQLPTAKQLAALLTPQVMGFTSDEEGLVLQGYSSTTLGVGLLPLVAVAGEALKRSARRGGEEGGEEPAVEGRMVEERQLLRDIHKHLNNYARDNQGQFPAVLTAMVPQYFQPADAEKLGRVTYLGKQAQDHLVLAYLGPAQGNRPVPVLLQNGSVKVIRSRELPDVLQNGVREDGPAKGEAVKPPAPPPEF